MKTKLFLALGLSLPLSGCMMAGMVGMAGMGHTLPGGTHGESPTTVMSGPLIVKELVADGIRVTAEFPSFGPNDSLAYAVTLRDLSGRAISSDASVFLSASRATGEGAHGHDPALTRLSPALRDEGSLVFRPSLPRDGSYRLTVLVERVGDSVLDPPLVLDQVVQFAAQPAHDAGSGHVADGAGMTSLLLLGAGLMAVMMLFAFR